MPRSTENAACAKSAEAVQAGQSLELYDDDDEVEEEEVEYEEIEEEVEEEEEDTVEEVEEQVDDEEEDPEETEGLTCVTNDEKEKEKHAELLSLPPHGSEVYVGGISSDASSEDLKELCQPFGEVVEVRLMSGKRGSKGYGFVTFRTKDLALGAIKKLNNASLKGSKIRASSSQAKNKIFIGNVPRSWTHDDLKKAVAQVGPGVIKVDLMKDPQSNRNRGYGFVEYYNHACAEYARQKMSTPKFKLDTNAPTISWADPNPKNGESTSTAQVKSIYVKNLPKSVTQEQLKKLFEHHGEITKVVLPPAKAGQEKRYGFVHFKERPDAMKALKNTERYELDGHLLDCSLAKPPADWKDDTVPVPVPNAKGGPLLPSYAPHGYGIMPVPGAYGALPHAGIAHAGIAQPMLYAPRAPPGATMVPMVLPDGRFGYVLQLPAGHQAMAAPSPRGQQGGRYGGGGSGRFGAKRQSEESHSGSRTKGRHRPY